MSKPRSIFDFSGGRPSPLPISRSPKTVRSINSPKGFRSPTSRRATRFSSSFALAWSEVLEAQDIFIGVNALDYSGYPDCRPEYIEAYQAMANLATKAAVETGRKVKIHTPLIDLTKGQIIARGIELGVDYGITVTCYDPGKKGEACGHCDACLLRRKGFHENGMEDPAPYQEGTKTAV